MPKLIKNGEISNDPWTLLSIADNADVLAALPGKAIMVPLQFWQDFRDEIALYDGRVTIWLDSHEEFDAIADELGEFPVIGLNFPVFSDGRAYSKARELRQKYRYQGDIRAIGDVLRDQLYFMLHCGFSSFALRHDQDAEESLVAFNDFTTNYQATEVDPLPLFRRRQAS